MKKIIFTNVAGIESEITLDMIAGLILREQQWLEEKAQVYDLLNQVGSATTMAMQTLVPSSVEQIRAGLKDQIPEYHKANAAATKARAELLKEIKANLRYESEDYVVEKVDSNAVSHLKVVDERCE